MSVVRIRRQADGFLVAEALVAMAIAVVVLTAIARVVAAGGEATRRARDLTCATLAGRQKVEQLRGVAWGIDASGVAVSGAELAPSPSDSLGRDIDGYCDFLDSSGQELAAGGTRPPAAAYTRRWNVAPLADAPARGLVVQVAVLGNPREAPLVRIVAIRTRKAP